MKFKKLKLYEWKQFQLIDIDFHSNLTLLTGANGAGKTTILNLLARHFGWHLNELATPAKDKSTGFFKFFARWFKSEIKSPTNEIGMITYDNGQLAKLTIPQDSNQAQYSVDIQSILGIKGLNIPSHRPAFVYQPVANISTQKRDKQQAYQLAHQSYSRLFSYHYSQTQSSNYYIKETLLNWAIGGSGNEFIQADEELKQNFLEFENILKIVLPSSLGFKKISIRSYEIVLETETGEFMIDAVSGGVSAIIDLAWQVFNCSEANTESITVLVDEIENHLHATMQRSILPSFIQAFPNIQFIISTHSPLIIGSVKESNVYALRYNEDKKIISELLDLENKAKNATEILNEVLGVSFTMPIWVEIYLNEIVEKYSTKNVDENTFEQMRAELKVIGLEDLMPIAIKDILSK